MLPLTPHMGRLCFTSVTISEKWRKTGLILSGILFYSIFLEICVHLITYNQFRIYDNWVHEAINHMANIAPIALMTAACTAIVFFLTDRWIFSRSYILKLLADIILTASATIGAYLLTLWVARAFISGYEINYGSILAIYMITLLMIEMIYYMNSANKAAKKAEQAKREAIQFQYDAFRAQVNPHFLFNSLNILMDIIENDKDKAVEFTEALSDIYRYVLSTHRRARVTVSEEFSFLEAYIHILTLKYNQFLKVSILNQISSTKYIIPFTMQVLMENVTKHNIISDRHPMAVSITATDDGIVMQNPIRRKKNSGTGLGLKYIMTQYRTFGKSFTISDDGEYFTVKIPFI